MNLINKISELYKHTLIKIVHVSAVYYTASALTTSLHGDPLYHISGFVSAGVGRVMDHASTIPLIKLINKPGAEYLKMRYKEGNIFIGEHPTMRQYVKRVVLQDLFLLGFSTFMPSVGYAYLSFMPFIYVNNKNIVRRAKALFNSKQLT